MQVFVQEAFDLHSSDHSLPAVANSHSETVVSRIKQNETYHNVEGQLTVCLPATSITITWKVS